MVHLLDNTVFIADARYKHEERINQVLTTRH